MGTREAGALAELAAAFWQRLPDHTALAVQPYLSTAYSYRTDEMAPGGAASEAVATGEPACVRALRVRSVPIGKTLWHVGVAPADWVCLLACRLIDYLDRRGHPVPAAADVRRAAGAAAAARGESHPPPPREVLGPVLRAARFVARYDYATALYLLPVVIAEVAEEDDLDVVQRTLVAARATPDATCAGPACAGRCAPPDARPGRDFVAAEFSYALRGGGAECVQVVFHLLDAEASGADETALILHQRSIAEAPADIGRQTGYLRCLAALGHWETVLMHTELLGLGRGVRERAAGGGEAVMDATSRTKGAPEPLRAVAAAFGVEAAWRLGRWDRLADEAPLAPPPLAVASAAGVAAGGATHPWGLAAGAPATGDGPGLVGGGWEAAYQTAVGRMFVALRRRDAPGLASWADAARAALMGPASSAAANHYVCLYPYVRALHLVAEVEDA
eukprot:contig_7649_g1792